MKLFEGLAAVLEQRRVSTLFGLMGDANLFFVDAFVRSGAGRYVSVAHESTAVLAALGFARVTGEVGVATVTHGPAVTNTITALIQGARARTPMVLIAGDTALVDQDNLQNLPQREAATLAEAPFVLVRSADTWQADVERAFHLARERSRPVFLDVPIDLMWAEVELAPSRIAPPRALSYPDDAAMDTALGAAAAARRPLVLAGRGASGDRARAALIRLADVLGAPLLTTLEAKGLFSGEPERDFGVFGGLAGERGSDAIGSADCILAFGASLNGFTTEMDSLIAGKRVVVCDRDLARIRTDLQDAVAVEGDAAVVAELMTQALEEAIEAPTGFRDALNARVPTTSERGLAPIEDAYRVLDETLPPSRILVTDAGRFLPLAWRSLSVSHPRDLISTVHLGSIGLGMGYAIGAACAAEDIQRPDPVVLVTGDGGYMLGGYTELTTAIRHGLELTVVVMNDHSYGAEYVQFDARGMAADSSTFDWPSFAAVAVAAGATAWTVHSLEELREALTAPSDHRPRLIDLQLDPAAVPNAIPAAARH